MIDIKREIWLALGSVVSSRSSGHADNKKGYTITRLVNDDITIRITRRCLEQNHLSFITWDERDSR
jgi:hypothetical protein